MAVDNKGFSALAVRLSDQVKAISYLFVRRHVDAATDNGGTALFVAGLPVVHHPMTAALEAVFSAFGEVLSTVIHQSQVRASCLYTPPCALAFSSGRRHSLLELACLEADL